jgi:hypothetical protein
MELQLYANLVAKVDDALLLEQTGIAIRDAVGEPCRITIDTVMPESGLEFDGRKRLGDVVRVSVHVMRRGDARDISEALVEVTGKVVDASTTQRPQGTVCHTFTVQHGESDPGPRHVMTIAKGLAGLTR